MVITFAVGLVDAGSGLRRANLADANRRACFILSRLRSGSRPYSQAFWAVQEVQREVQQEVGQAGLWALQQEAQQAARQAGSQAA
jgi:hypothetical protein